MIKKDKKEVELIKVNNMLEVGGKIDRKDNAFEKLMIIYTSAMKTLRTKLRKHYRENEQKEFRTYIRKSN